MAASFTYKDRADWLLVAARGERATLAGQPCFLAAIAGDEKLREDVMHAAICKRGLPVFSWLTKTYAPSASVMRHALGVFPNEAIEKVLSYAPWPKGEPSAKVFSLKDMIMRHPKGWFEAIRNMESAIRSGMPFKDEDYGLLFLLASTKPKDWARLSSQDGDHALKHVLTMGGLKEWDTLARPSVEHPISIALDRGNIQAVAWMLEATKTRLTPQFLETLAWDGLRPAGSAYQWNWNEDVQAEYLKVLFDRSGRLKEYLVNEVSKLSSKHKMSPTLVPRVEAMMIHQSTPQASAPPRAPRL